MSLSRPDSSMPSSSMNICFSSGSSSSAISASTWRRWEAPGHPRSWQARLPGCRTCCQWDWRRCFRQIGGIDDVFQTSEDRRSGHNQLVLRAFIGPCGFALVGMPSRPSKSQPPWRYFLVIWQPPSLLCRSALYHLKSAITSSRLMMSISRSGSVLPSTWVMLLSIKAAHSHGQWRPVGRMLLRTCCPDLTLGRAFTSPAMSTDSMTAGGILRVVHIPQTLQPLVWHRRPCPHWGRWCRRDSWPIEHRRW